MKKHGSFDGRHLRDEIWERAGKINPAAFTSYAGHARIDAQRAALKLAEQQLNREEELERDEIDEKLGRPGAAECMSPAARKFLLNLCTEEMAALGKPMPEGTMTMCYGDPAPRYSVNDLDRMRKAIDRTPKYRLGFDAYGHDGANKRVRHREEILRTFMLNGTKPHELEAEADKAWAEINARRAARIVEQERERQSKLWGNNTAIDKALASVNGDAIADKIVTPDLDLSIRQRVTLRVRIAETIRRLVA